MGALAFLSLTDNAVAQKTAALQAALGRLRDPAPEMRIRGVIALADLSFRSFERGPAFVEALGDPEPVVREEASEALREMGNSAVEALVAGLEATDVEVRLRIVELLAARVEGSARAESVLRAAAEKDSDRKVRKAAAKAVKRSSGSVAEENGLSVVLQGKPAAGPAEGVPAGVQGRPLEAWLEDLRLGGPEDRQQAARALARLTSQGDVRVPAEVLKIVWDRTAERGARRSAIQLLRHLSHIFVVVELEKRPDAPKELSAALWQCFREADVPCQLARRLPAGTGAAVLQVEAEVLVEFVRRGEVSSLAEAALGGMEPPAPAAIPALVEALAPKPLPESLSEGQRFLQAVDRWIASVSWVAAQALGLIGAEAMPALLEALKSPEGLVRQYVVEALREMGPEAREGAPELADRLRTDPDSLVRAGAGRALAEMGPEGQLAVPHLLEALAHPAPEIRRSAAIALGRIGPAAAPATEAVLAAWKDQTPEVRTAAAEALGRIGGAAVPMILERIEDKKLRPLALAALEHVGPPVDEQTRAALIRLLGHSSREVRSAAVRALGQLGAGAGSSSVPPLIERLGERSSVCGDAAFALGAIGLEAETAVPALREALGRCDRMLVACALGGFGRGAAAAVPDLTKLLRDKDAQVRRCAVEALDRIENTGPGKTF